MQINFERKSESCILCGSKRLKPAFSLSFNGQMIHWDHCEPCDLYFQNPRLTEKSIQTIYSSEVYWGRNVQDASAYSNYQYQDSVRILQSRHRLDKIKRVSGLQSGRLLDIGCAAGYFLFVCRQQGFDVTGVDPSPQMAEYVKQRYGIEILCNILENCTFQEQSYDLVTMWGTDSHFLNPRKSFEKLAVALKPGGFIAMNYQDFAHPVRFFFPQIKKSWNALYNFTSKSLRFLFDRVGLKIIYHKPEWQWTTLDHVLRILQVRGQPAKFQIPLFIPAVSFSCVIAQKK